MKMSRRDFWKWLWRLERARFHGRRDKQPNWRTIFCTFLHVWLGHNPNEWFLRDNRKVTFTPNRLVLKAHCVLPTFHAPSKLLPQICLLLYSRMLDPSVYINCNVLVLIDLVPPFFMSVLFASSSANEFTYPHATLCLCKSNHDKLVKGSVPLSPQAWGKCPISRITFTVVCFSCITKSLRDAYFSSHGNSVDPLKHWRTFPRKHFSSCLGSLLSSNIVQKWWWKF